MRILVVDHNAERAAIVRQALVDIGGYLVEVAPKAGDLLTLLRTAQPDVLVVDLDLPDRDTRSRSGRPGKQAPRRDAGKAAPDCHVRRSERQLHDARGHRSRRIRLCR